MRLLLTFLVLAVLVIVPFVLWGDRLMSTFSTEGAVDWISQYGRWAWAAGIVLLVGDLFLPLPATIIMSALGYLYGLFWGGLLAAGGSFLSGCLAYGLCRALGRRGALFILGEKDLARGERLFAGFGGWLVALSRWLPVFPEVIACMAGLSRMRAGTFCLALACGSVPLGITFAAVGNAGVQNPSLAILLSAVLPPVLWAILRLVIRRGMLRTERDATPASE